MAVKNHKFLSDNKVTNLLYLFGAILLAGTIISGIYTRDTRWIDWSFSRLGEGTELPAIFYNIVLFIAGIVAFALHVEIDKGLNSISESNNQDIRTGKILVYWSFLLISICFWGVAVFPFDHFPVIHNVFGYSILTILLILSVVIEKYLPIFSKKFYIYSGWVLPVTALSYAMFAGLRIATLISVESIIFVMLYGWLLLLAREIQSARVQ